MSGQASRYDVSIRSRRSGREEHASAGQRLPSRVFQSAPGAQAGRNTVEQVPGEVGEVSIRSRRSGREERVRRRARDRCRRCFNPLPALRPGGTAGQLAAIVRERVSIRSRRSGREEHVAAGSPRCGANRFQSAPGAQAGRNAGRSRPIRDCACFNPLPALRPGGTRPPCAC